MFLGGCICLTKDDNKKVIDSKIGELKKEFNYRIKIELDKINNVIYYHQVLKDFNEVDRMLN